ncbi:MAG: PAS domain-containing protein [Desulfobacteraceae bacterium]|nr:PAS domain-containing protein [Desulfobacteraceae bacterium]
MKLVPGSKDLLARQLLVYILLVSSLFTLMATGLQLWVDYTKDVDLLGTRIHEVRKTYMDSLSLSIWNMNVNHVDAQLKGILKLPEISCLELETLDTTYGVGEKPPAIRRVVFEFPIEYVDPQGQFDPETVGRLIIHGDLRYIYERLRDRVLIILGAQAVKTFSVSVFVLFLIWYFVSRHLHRMSEFAGDLNLENLGAPLVLAGDRTRKNELDMVVDALNSMRVNLIQARESLTKELRTQQRLNASLVKTIRDRDLAEKSLSQSEARFRVLVDNIPGAVYRSANDPAWTMEFISDTIEGISGYPGSDFISGSGRRFCSIIHLDDAPGVRQKIEKCLEKQEPYSLEYRIVHAGGDIRWVNEKGQGIYSSNGTLASLVGAFFDVTERRRTQEMMIQTEKMMSVGGLAAGMAHEINNPLAGILQNTQVMRNRVSNGLPKNRKEAEACGTTIETIVAYMEKRGVYSMIEAIMESGKRAAVIVDNMLSFSRRSESRFDHHDLAELLDNSVRLLGTDYDLRQSYDFKNIEIRREYDDAVPKVPCEAGKIQQVFLNILKNGAQAMRKTREAGTRPCFVLRLKVEGRMARIEIEDNGPGMDEVTKKRVFEPFFTTKAVGAGTGLGLSVSYFIITENQGGTLAVESAPGKGATFIIHLPLEQHR